MEERIRQTEITPPAPYTPKTYPDEVHAVLTSDEHSKQAKEQALKEHRLREEGKEREKYVDFRQASRFDPVWWQCMEAEADSRRLVASDRMLRMCCLHPLLRAACAETVADPTSTKGASDQPANPNVALRAVLQNLFAGYQHIVHQHGNAKTNNGREQPHLFPNTPRELELSQRFVQTQTRHAILYVPTQLFSRPHSGPSGLGFDSSRWNKVWDLIVGTLSVSLAVVYTSPPNHGVGYSARQERADLVHTLSQRAEYVSELGELDLTCGGSFMLKEDEHGPKCFVGTDNVCDCPVRFSQVKGPFSWNDLVKSSREV